MGIPTSVGMTTSVQYARANRVFPVGLPGVLSAYRTPDSSSTHFPLVFSNRFFNALNKVLLVASA